MDRLVERELRQDIKEINEKVTNLQISVNKEMANIQGSLKVLKSRQNTGASICKMIFTVVVAVISGIFGSHL